MNATTNPTPLRIGQSGVLCGLRFRIVGRVVLGTTEDGETYYWNEFNVVDDTGKFATLVYEEGENGPEWKMFMLFEPTRPMSVSEASSKRLGDRVNLDGTPVAVTYLGQSRVYHIEGQAPEGVEVGDIARYFNADTGPEMWVVSWTGNEVEYYRGVDVPPQDVGTAFGVSVTLPTSSAFRSDDDAEGPTTSSGYGKKIIMAAVVAGIGFVAQTMWRGSRRAPVPKKLPTMVTQLALGKTNAWGALTGHATVELMTVGAQYYWHEYRLDGDVLLVGGLTGGDEWHLLQTAPPNAPLTPREAAALRVGQSLVLDGQSLQVSGLFWSRVTGREGEGTNSPGAVLFGFIARSSNEVAVVRWTETALESYRGRAVPGSEVKSAFAK